VGGWVGGGRGIKAFVKYRELKKGWGVRREPQQFPIIPRIKTSLNLKQNVCLKYEIKCFDFKILIDLNCKALFSLY
jgi:hypothetical protein